MGAAQGPVAAVDLTPADWKNPPKLMDVKADLQSAKISHDAQVSRIQRWLDNLNVEGAAKVKPKAGSSQHVPRLIRKQAEWRYASLSEPFLSAEDIFDIRPRTWEDKEAAIQNGILLNHQFSVKLSRVDFIDEYVRTAVDEGTAIVKVSWDFEEEDAVEEVPEVELTMAPELLEIMQRLDQLKAENPNHYQRDVPQELIIAHEMWEQTQIPYRPMVIGTKQVEVKRTVRNQPNLEVCDYRNLIIDPTAKGNIKKAQFVIHSFESSISDLKKDGKYKNLDAVLVSQNSILGDPDHATEDSAHFKPSDETRQKVVVYEYWGSWDIDGDGLLKPIVMAWIGDVNIRMGANPYPDKKHPFVSVQYLPVRKKTHGEPDGHLLEDNQKIMGAVTRGMIDIMGKGANGQTAIRKDALDPVNRRRYDKGMDYEFNPNVRPEEAFYMHKYAEIPNSAQFMLNLQNFDAESITGVKSFSQGITGDSLGNVATGVRGALDAASKRELGIVRRLAAGLVEIGRKIMAMNAVYLDDEEVIRVTNDQFIAIRKNELNGEFDMRVAVTTAEEDNAKAQELSFMLQTVGPNSDPMVMQIIMSEIARLRKMPDLAKMIKEYQPEPDPVAEQIKLLTLQKLEVEIAEIQARTQKLGTAAVVDQAKARQLDSDADLNNLDFVEQESGVKQARDVEKIGEQARSNIQLEGAKAEIKDRVDARDIVAAYLKKSAK